MKEEEVEEPSFAAHAELPERSHSPLSPPPTRETQNTANLPEPTASNGTDRLDAAEVQEPADEFYSQMVLTKTQKAHKRRRIIGSRLPISRLGERPVLKKEILQWGPSLRIFIFITALRGNPDVLLKQFYKGILSGNSLAARINGRVKLFRHELRNPESKTIFNKVEDEHGLKSFDYLYYPANQEKELYFRLRGNKQPLTHIDRDEPMSIEFINSVMDGFVLHGISVVRILNLITQKEVYTRLFGPFHPVDDVPEVEVPRPVLKHLKSLLKRQKEEGFESLLQASISNLIDYAPSLEIGHKLLRIQKTLGIKGLGGRFMNAGVEWYNTWQIVYNATVPEGRAVLEDTHKAVEAWHQRETRRARLQAQSDGTVRNLLQGSSQTTGGPSKGRALAAPQRAAPQQSATPEEMQDSGS